MSSLSIDADRHDRQDSGCRQLLAMHGVRRDLECLALGHGVVRWTAMAVTRTQAVRELLELIAALDRRLPQMHRAGEASIARDAAALKARALKRIDELEREPFAVETP
jgi:hypothetical protein